MSNLLRDLLALQKHINEDETVEKKPEAAPAEAAPANPVAAEPVAPKAETEPAVAATAEPVDADDEQVEEEYEDSAEFTEEFYSLFQKVEEVRKVIDSPKFTNWMKITDTNFSTRVQELVPPVSKALDMLKDALDDLEEELEKAA